MWRYIFGVGQHVYVCVFLFGIEEREVENGVLEKERKEEHVSKNLSKNFVKIFYFLILRNKKY